MNLPNKISLTRILLIPFFVFFYLASFIPGGKIISFAIFVIACGTDFIDGQIARKRNLVTDLGKLLDTTADKMLVTGGLLLVIADQTIPMIFGAIIGLLILGRDFIIMCLRSLAAKKGYVLAADWWGKWKQGVIDVAIALLLFLSAGVFTGTAAYVFEIICMIAIWAGAALSVISCINYLVKNKGVFKENNESKPIKSSKK